VVECQLRSANAVNESTYDEFLTWCFELEEHHQKALQENTELAEEVEQLKMQLKKRTAEIEKVSKTVNDMDQVSFFVQSSHSCQLFLPPLLSDIMVYDSIHLLYSRDT
jgi:regulator of replication initiation timing